MMRHIYIDFSNEWDNFVGIIDWPSEMANRFESYISFFDSIKDKNEDLKGIEFHASVDLYEYGPWFNDWLEKLRLIDAWGDGRLLITKHEPGPEGMVERVRTDMVQLNVSDIGFWWTVIPKHSDTAIESSWFSRPTESDRLIRVGKQVS